MSGFYTPPNVRGEDKQIQYNENGVLSASSDLIWDDATKDLTVGGNLDVAWHTELDDLNVSGVSTFQNLDINSNSIRLRTTKTPASATDTGEEGQICWDADYVYVCVGTDTWKRSAISTW